MKRKASKGAKRLPGQRAGLTAESVIDCARKLIKAEGIERLSIRQIAAQLGVAPNALYTYFPDKAAILDALVDSTLSDIDLSNVGGGLWTEDLISAMKESRRVMLQNPELLQLFLTRPAGPSALWLGEVVLGILQRRGLSSADAVAFLRALLAYLMGFVALEIPRRESVEVERRSQRLDSLLAANRSVDLPLSREVRSYIAAPPSDDEFEKGLQALIDGWFTS